MSGLPRIVLSAILPFVFLVADARAEGEPVRVFAASSLHAAITAVADLYASREGVRPALTLDASSILAKQIEGGAAAEIFISADEQAMERLVARGLIVFGTSAPLAGNQLALVAPAARPFHMDIVPGLPLAALLGDDKLAMADPESAASGRYSQAALVSLGAWNGLERNVVRAPDARSTLALVERDEVRAGIVYSTEALGSRAVRLVGFFPATSHAPIVYSLAIVAGRDRPEVRKLREFLLSAESKAIFQRLGFLAK